MTNHPPTKTPPAILSLFPGVDLLGLAFERLGYSVLRGPDLLWGRTIADFTPPQFPWFGVIAGPPCQDFSAARRRPATRYGYEMLQHTRRCILAAQPEWWLIENVPAVPDFHVDGYTWQRLRLDQACFSDVARRRHFQYGAREPHTLVVPHGPRHPHPKPTVLGHDSRPYAEIAALQGLPPAFTLPSFTRQGAKQAVGNGVPLALGSAMARAILTAHNQPTAPHHTTTTPTTTAKTTCKNCHGTLRGQQLYCSNSCRQNAFRKRHQRTLQPLDE